MTVSATHLVLIPAFNPGPRLASTVEEALRHWAPVWVVVDGSTDGSDAPVRAQAVRDLRVRVLTLPRNRGKGAAIEAGAAAALAAGYTHVLTMDADGQHPAGAIAEFMRESALRPRAMILGRPIFGPEAPAARRQGRKLSIALARLEILGRGIDDPLFGFRVYPLEALRRVFAATSWARRFDFDHEAAVRAFWDGTPAANVPAPCRYLSHDEGGVSHFHYLRDNLLLIWLQLRLLSELALRRWPAVVRLRRTGAPRRPRGAVLLLAGALALLPGAARAAPAPIGLSDPAWAALFSRLALRGDRESSFEERRFVPFRRTPLVLRGEVRISPERGLSLDYEAPERRILIVDSRGILIRRPDGRQRALPAAGRVGDAVSALLDILRFDRRELARRFRISGSRSGDAWTLELRPRDPADAAAFAAAVIRGEGDRPRSIRLIRSPREHIDIELGRTVERARFGPGVLARYFR